MARPVVLHHAGSEIDTHTIAGLNGIRSFDQFDHGEATVDSVAEEDARERWCDDGGDARLLLTGCCLFTRSVLCW